MVSELRSVQPGQPRRSTRPTQIPLSFHPTFDPDQIKIEIDDLGIFYSDGTESLRGVTFTIPARQITVLFGPAGGGKSTLLRTLNRLNDLADVVSVTGSVRIDGENILDPKTDVISLRRRVGMVFARPVVLPMSIRQNLTYGLELRGDKSNGHANELIEASLRSAALWEEVHDRLDEPAVSLSGGQQQRLCLARVLVLEPDIILLDEPTSGLDPISTGKVEASLQSLKQNYTIVIVPHSVQQAARIADYAAFFLDGHMIEYSRGSDIFTHPRHPKTQDYVEGRFG
jgi:phosphate transport system ATP-binding protein